MRDLDTPEPASQRPEVVFDESKELENAEWRYDGFNFPRIGPQSASQRIEHYPRSPPQWSTKHDFERRLSRNGIKISEASDGRASKTSTQTTVQQRGGALSILDGHARANTHRSSHYASRSEDFPPLEGATMASFTNTTKEMKVDALERQLRHAQAEMQVWKRQSERQARDLRAACKETMEWRMKYEDLYSKILQGVDSELSGKPKRRATKSFG